MEEKTKDRTALDWLDRLKERESDSHENKWAHQGKQIIKRYRDERPDLHAGARFNILWSNIETIMPATYARKPQVEVDRRNKDASPVARCASIILERALQFELDHYPDFDEAVKGAIKDRLLPGRGVAWVRFESYDVERPSGEAGNPTELAPENAQAEAIADQAMGAAPEMIEFGGVPEQPDVVERACLDYVYWEDFRHSAGRNWSDVTWVARRVFLTREEGRERFGDKFSDVPMVQEPTGLDSLPERTDGGQAVGDKRAEVWEIWDKATRKVFWVANGIADLLDEKDDPYGLEGFFPMPKPLYATQTTDRLTPVPDFHFYRDQAKELDLISTRINSLIKALRLVGVYDASNSTTISNLMNGPDNQLVPVEGWNQLSEKGGVGGVIQWVPLRDVAQALQLAENTREQTKAVIYEITGISDIIRGATKASETATAQNIKRQFGTLRLQDRQRDIAVFVTDILRMKAEMMADLYSTPTLIAMSGILNTPDGQYAEAAIQLLKAEPLRDYEIRVAADSLVAIDDEQAKQEAIEFVGMAGGFLQQAVAAAQAYPPLGNIAIEMLMMAVRRFKAGRPLEASFEQLQQEMQMQAQQGQQQQEDPAAQAEQARVQMEAQQAQQKMQVDAQMEQMRMQADMQIKQAQVQADMALKREQMQMQMQLEQQRAQMQAEVDQARAQADTQAKMVTEQSKLEFERWKVELQEATKIQIAQMNNVAKGVLQENEATQAATGEIAREIRP